ncbi:MAG: glycoside hydrolase family 10 protein [Phycisphaerae bacterium]
MRMFARNVGLGHGACRVRLMVVPGLLLGLSAGCQFTGHKSAARQDNTIRAIWVTRWDFKSPGDITRIMRRCQSSGFNTILFQVRGNGTVLYRSRMEPWANELGGTDPGFDPLQIACTEAHRRGLALHAWVNVIPGWRGKQPPTDPHQLYNARPDWFWRDASGRRQPLGWYNSVNPCYPEVRRYLADLTGEIAANYDVDGIHLDYIRFPNERNDSYPPEAAVPDYPRDPRTLAMFRKQTGQSPDSDPRGWDRWRTRQVTQLLREIRATAKRTKPSIALSAAVGPMPARAKRAHFQDSRQWLAERLLDAVYPMNYDADMRGFDRALAQWQRATGGIPVVMGIRCDGRDPNLVRKQLDRAVRSGKHFCVFAYNAIFERRDAHGRPVRDGQARARAQLRRRVVPQIRKLASAAHRKWLW